MTAYAELQVASNFSFLSGASHPDELIAAAKQAGLNALALTDRNTLAGVVRAHVAAKAQGLRFIVGCRLELQDGPNLLFYPKNRAAYGRLCRLLTLGKRRAEKGDCTLFLSDVYAHSSDQVIIVVPPATLDEHFQQQLNNIAGNLQATCYLGAHHTLNGDDRARLSTLSGLSHQAGVALIATNDVLYHHPERRQLQDVMTCIRETCRIEEAGFRLAKNAERHIKSPGEMARLFVGFEEALARTQDVQQACQFSLDELRYEYPDEPVPPGTTPQAHLENLTWDGARERYPAGIPKTVIASLHKELALIEQLSYAPYFLTVHDIVRYARTPQPDKGRLDPILCQGRGSAANSVVCFCLGITSVNPLGIDLLFERFISPERNEPPDIDVDFEHERREEVIQYIYDRYGRERAGIAATVISYRSRSAIRDVGKVMGLSEDVTAALAGTVWGSGKDAFPDKRLREAGLNPNDKRLKKTIELASELIGFPRHLSQHVGGFILTRGALSETVPIGNAAMEDRTFIEWDKDDINALGILKIDVLSLGMLTCIRKCFDLLEGHYNIAHTLASIPQNDKATYDMICNADTIGVFQIESRAQMNMLPRLKPQQFYDLVIEVAIVRPGPIQGDMVHPYLRRRSGKEKVVFPSPASEHGPADELKNVLGKTLGVPLFQEQAMRLAMVAANFTSTEVNALRHAMATFRHRGTIGSFEDKMVSRMVARGYDEGFSRRCFEQIKGFGEYGFPESHSASFALLAYVSSWLKCHHPDVFACGLLNAQPMGFYAPAQIVRDAKAHGCEVRAIDVNASDWDNRLEPAEHAPTGEKRHALRLGFRQIDGFREDFARAIVQARGNGYHDIDDLHARAGVPVHALERLAQADGLRSLGQDRRQALWKVKALAKTPALPLFAHAETQDIGPDSPTILPEMSLPEHVIADYQSLRLSLKAHPMFFLRNHFQDRGARVHGSISDIPDGTHMSVAGLVLVRQRPGTAKGVIFMTLEDETGVANIIVWPKTFETYRKVVMGGRLLLVRGKLQSHENVIHLIATHLEDHGALLNDLMNGNGPFKGALSNADEARRPQYPRGGGRHPRNERMVPQRVVPKSRDFH